MPPPSPRTKTLSVDGFPRWTYQGILLDPARLRYAPHPDIIHPSVIATADCAPGAPAPYLMYYAPHDTPGGICLATAAHPEGPWWEYPQNPVISADWPPHHQVSHISSPHAVWHAGEQRLFLYYHGENDTTHYVTSTDGVHFTYGGVAVNTAMLEPGVSEASYARVFPWNAGFVMLLMGNHQGTRKIYLAESSDGRRWEPRPTAWISPPPGYDQMGPGSLVMWQGAPHLICFGNLEGAAEFEPVSDLLHYRCNPALSEAVFAGVLMDHTAAGPHNLRINDPCLLEENGRLYLYLNVGRRLHQRIGWALALR